MFLNLRFGLDLNSCYCTIFIPLRNLNTLHKSCVSSATCQMKFAFSVNLVDIDEGPFMGVIGGPIDSTGISK